MSNRQSPWQQYTSYRGSDQESYYKAELVAVHRAVHILKQLGRGEVVTYRKLMTDSVEYANGFPGIGAKYRDVDPRLRALADYGVVHIDGDPDDWDNATVRVTAKGFLARPEEWYDERTKEDEDVDFSLFSDKHIRETFVIRDDDDE